jgi:hypothetical protein
MPSVVFELASYTTTASEIHPRTSKSCISCSRSTPDPKSSASARSSPIRNPKTLCSPAARGRDLRSQNPVGTAVASSRYTTLPTCTPLVRPLAAKIIPPRVAAEEPVVEAEDGRSSRIDFTACSTTKNAHTQQGTARRRRPPEIGCLGRNQPTTQELSRTHINNSHHQTTTAPLSIHPTTHTNIRRYKSCLPHPHLYTRNSQTSITPMHQNKKTSLISRIVESFT